jgi:outer membrane biosynthesis protein TonB
VDFEAWRAEHANLSEQGLYHEDSVTVRPARLDSPHLQYPRELRDEGWSGLVHLLAVVDTLGSVMLVELVHAGARLANREAGLRPDTPTTEHESAEKRREAAMLFSEAAVQAILNTRFRPGSVDGRPVRTVICLPFEFVPQTP